MTRDELMQIGHDAGFDTSKLTGEVIAPLECVAEHAEALLEFDPAEWGFGQPSPKHGKKQKARRTAQRAARRAK